MEVGCGQILEGFERFCFPLFCTECTPKMFGTLDYYAMSFMHVQRGSAKSERLETDWWVKM